MLTKTDCADSSEVGTGSPRAGFRPGVSVSGARLHAVVERVDGGGEHVSVDLQDAWVAMQHRARDVVHISPHKQTDTSMVRSQPAPSLAGWRLHPAGSCPTLRVAFSVRPVDCGPLSRMRYAARFDTDIHHERRL